MNRVVDPGVESPEHTVDSEFNRAQQQALITMFTEMGGRKAGLRYMELTEAAFALDPQLPENVTLMRGEEHRRLVATVRQRAFNWCVAHSSAWRRAIRRA